MRRRTCSRLPTQSKDQVAISYLATRHSRKSEFLHICDRRYSPLQNDQCLKRWTSGETYTVYNGPCNTFLLVCEDFSHWSPAFTAAGSGPLSVRSLLLRHRKSQPRLFAHLSMTDHTPRKAHLPVYPGLGLKNDRYTIRRKLGEGVFSATYLVEDAEIECDPKRWRL